MMKQADDTKTMELLDPVKRGRGRPAAPISDEERQRIKKEQAAERQRRHRERLRDDGKVSITAMFPAELMEKLDVFLKFKDETKDHAVERALVAFLRKR
jgi:hypothetical protein